MEDIRIQEFANKWLTKFNDEKSTGRDLADDISFADDCFSFGFNMDCGQAFINAFPDRKAFDDWRELDAVICSVDNIALLGSAIFSKWRYFNHWAYSPDEITKPDNRQWFMIALTGLMRLATKS